MEVDDFYVCVHSGARGWGCGKQVVIAAVERGMAEALGRLYLRALPCCGPGACSAFAE